MGNKQLPRKLTLGAGINTRLDSIIKREQMLVLNNAAATLGLTNNPAETAVGNCYPIAGGEEFNDISGGPLYGVSAAGGEVWVWETEK